MCLSKATFTLKYSPTNGYTGLGFKKGKPDRYKVGTWYKAIGTRYGKPQESKTAPKKLDELPISGVTYHVNSYKEIDKETCLPKVQHGTNITSYPLGFHIFLHLSDARSYRHIPNEEGIYLVEYKNIIGFGENETNYSRTGECVIALDMRFIKKVK